MNKLYMGLDIGSVMTKGVIIDEKYNIITSACLNTEGNPINATKKIINIMKKNIDINNNKVVSVGVTGSARKLVGIFLSANVIKNEITALAIGTMRLYPKVRTIFEIGGQDAKIILVNNEEIIDYSINTLCFAGTGLFLNSIAKQLNVSEDDITNMALLGNNSINVTSKCMIFVQTDLINKIQNGYKVEDVMASLCKEIAINYINNVVKGKRITSPIVFSGGISRNKAVVKELENILHEKIIVNKNSHLMGAIGVAIIGIDSGIESEFDFDIDNSVLETRLVNCSKCINNCEIVEVYKNDNLIDYWGNRCNNDNKIKNM